MVKNNFIALSTLILGITSTTLFAAGDFSSNVSTTQVQLGDSFTLNLTLKDASPKDLPTITGIKNNFIVHSQQQSSNTTIHNGKVSSSVTWKLTLTPKTEGAVQIPAITVNTAEGTLSTQPITLNVTKSSNPSTTAQDEPKITTKISNTSPYKNESFLYTALLTSKTPLYNVQTQKIKAEDAIVELLIEPKLEERVIDGVLLNVIEFSYLVTPLKAGSLSIPSIVIQGATPQKRKEQYGKYYNDEFDPFAIMQGYDRLKPFSLMTEEMKLDVQPAIPDVSPWIPAKELAFEEQWPSEQTLRVGEIFSRGILIKSEGLKASQLPHLEDRQSEGSTFKVYADKPKEQEKILQGTLHSTRQEQYTFIPQKPGTWVLPEISINWWDTVKKEKRTSTIPTRTIQILPAVETATSAPLETAPIAQATEDPTSAPTPTLLYSIIAALSLLLASALLWVATLKRKIASLSQTPSQKHTPPPPIPKKVQPAPPSVQKTKKEKLPDLNPT